MIDVTMQIIRNLKLEDTDLSRSKAFSLKRAQELWMADVIRLTLVKDETYDLAMLKGDCFKSDCNPHTSDTELRAQERAFEERVERDGVWGLVGEYLDSNSEWQHADSCFGFVGMDAIGSGYDLDILLATISDMGRERATVNPRKRRIQK